MSKAPTGAEVSAHPWYQMRAELEKERARADRAEAMSSIAPTARVDDAQHSDTNYIVRLIISGEPVSWHYCDSARTIAGIIDQALKRAHQRLNESSDAPSEAET